MDLLRERNGNSRGMTSWDASCRSGNVHASAYPADEGATREDPVEETTEGRKKLQVMNRRRMGAGKKSAKAFALAQVLPDRSGKRP
jgi:hypothetical protein